MIADDCGVNIDFPEHIAEKVGSAEKVGRAEGEYLHWTISDLIFIFAQNSSRCPTLNVRTWQV